MNETLILKVKISAISLSSSQLEDLAAEFCGKINSLAGNVDDEDIFIEFSGEHSQNYRNGLQLALNSFLIK